MNEILLSEPPNYRLGVFITGYKDETCFQCPEYSYTEEQWTRRVGTCAKFKKEVGEYMMCDDWIHKVYKTKAEIID